MSKIRIILILKIFLLTWVISLTQPAFSMTPEVLCKTEIIKGKNIAQCSVVFIDHREIDTVTLIDSKKLNQINTIFTANQINKKKSAWTFLIDRSNPARMKAVEAMRSHVINIISEAKGNIDFEIYTFADTLEKVVNFGTKIDEAKKSISNIQAAGLATELNRYTLEIIENFNNDNDDVDRILVILSDGKAEDTAYTFQDVISAAKKKNVRIFGIGIPQHQTDLPSLQQLRRISEETNGIYITANLPNWTLTKEFQKKYFLTIENGGSLKFELPQFNQKLILNGQIILKDKTVENFDITFNEASIDGKNNVVNDQKKNFQEKIIIKIKELYYIINSNKYIFLFTIVLLFAFLTLLAFYLKRNFAKKNKIKKDNIKAFFHLIDSDYKQIAISGTNVQIGRHSSNDIIFEDLTIHRKHAVLSWSSGCYTISDLKTDNGILVNNKRVENQKLESGDVIELGELKLKFNYI